MTDFQSVLVSLLQSYQRNGSQIYKCLPPKKRYTKQMRIDNATENYLSVGACCTSLNNQRKVSIFAESPKDESCPLCNKQFETISQKKSHVRRHVNKNLGQYSCDFCHKHFVQQSSLRNHRRIHTGVKPYLCRVCETAFSDLSTFRKHERIHTGEKPYVCDYCMRAFTQSGNMRRHLKGCKCAPKL